MQCLRLSGSIFRFIKLTLLFSSYRAKTLCPLDGPPFLRPLFTTHSDRTWNHTVPVLSLVRFPYPSAPKSIRITISAGIFFCKGKVILHHTGTPYFGRPFIL